MYAMQPINKEYSIEITNESEKPVSVYLTPESMGAKRSLLISPHQTRLLRMLINGSIEVRGKSPNESYHISYAQMPNGDIGVIGGYLKDINPDEAEKPLLTIDQDEKLEVFIMPNKISLGKTYRLP